MPVFWGGDGPIWGEIEIVRLKLNVRIFLLSGFVHACELHSSSLNRCSPFCRGEAEAQMFVFHW